LVRKALVVQNVDIDKIVSKTSPFGESTTTTLQQRRDRSSTYDPKDDILDTSSIQFTVEDLMMEVVLAGLGSDILLEIVQDRLNPQAETRKLHSDGIRDLKAWGNSSTSSFGTNVDLELEELRRNNYFMSHVADSIERAWPCGYTTIEQD
jgi:hypothetical protein